MWLLTQSEHMCLANMWLLTQSEHMCLANMWLLTQSEHMCLANMWLLTQSEHMCLANMWLLTQSEHMFECVWQNADQSREECLSLHAICYFQHAKITVMHYALQCHQQWPTVTATYTINATSRLKIRQKSIHFYERDTLFTCIHFGVHFYTCCKEYHDH
jgi:histidinol dehydrogenase